MLSAPRPRARAALPRAVALGREAGECVERSRCASQGEMASYVDNSFRQAVMKNPAERTPQVRRAASRRGVGVCRLRPSSAPALLCWGSIRFPPSRTSPAPTSKGILFKRSAIVALSSAVLYAALPVADLARGSAGLVVYRVCVSPAPLSWGSESWGSGLSSPPPGTGVTLTAG